MPHLLLPFNYRIVPLMNECLFIDALGPSHKYGCCHLMRKLELHLFLVYFPKKYTENKAAKAIANTLKRTSGRKGKSGQKKGLEVLQTLVQTRLKMKTG